MDVIERQRALVLRTLRDHAEPISVEKLCCKTLLPIDEVITATTSLIQDGQVRMEPPRHPDDLLVRLAGDQ